MDPCSLPVITEIKCYLEDKASRITGIFVGVFSLSSGQLIIAPWNCTCLGHSQLRVRYSVSLHINRTAVNLWKTSISCLENEGTLAWSSHPKTKGKWFDKAVYQFSSELARFQEETKHMYVFPRHKTLCLQLQAKFQYSWCACFHIQSPIYLYHMPFVHN